MLTYICFVVSDTESIYKKVFATVLSKYGKKYTSEMQMKIMGTPETNAVQTLIRDLKLPVTPEQLAVEFKSHSSKVLVNCNLMPGIMADYKNY